MTARKQPTLVMHFTPVEHLPTVIDCGLLSDAAAHAKGVLTTEVGNRGIKDRRRNRPVPIEPGGVVADYVPFYFGPRSPMMSAIANGRVEEYHVGTSRLVYLITTLERLVDHGYLPVLTDRNAALGYADYRQFEVSDPLDDGFIDWAIMRAQYWGDYDDGRERRMAECLVRDQVAWDAFAGIVTRNDVVAAEVQAVLAETRSSIPVNVRPNWYF